MLYDCFHLSNQYKVSKRLTINHFLSGANLLSTEREMVAKYICDIMLMYDVICGDCSEIVFVGAKINYRIHDTELDKIAKAIASSIPHHMVVTLYIGNNARIFLFETVENQGNSKRRVIKHTASTDLFSAPNPEFYAKAILDVMRNTAFSCQSAEEIMDGWMSELRAIRSAGYSYTRAQERKALERMAFFESMIENEDLIEDEYCLRDYYDDIDIVYQKNLVACMSKHAITYYDEFRRDNKDDSPQEDFLSEIIDDVLDRCSTIMKLHCDRGLLTSEKCVIVKALMKREYDRQADEVDIIDYAEFDEFH